MTSWSHNGKVVPYGVYDIATNQGWVNVGIDTTQRPLRSRAFAAGGSAWADTLSRGQEPSDHRGLRRQQWHPGAPVEARDAASRRRDRPLHHRCSSATRHQQVEQNRASPVLLHHAELARQAPAQPQRHRPADRRHHHQDSGSSSPATSMQPNIPRVSKSPRHNSRLSISATMISTRIGTTRSTQSYPRPPSFNHNKSLVSQQTLSDIKIQNYWIFG